MKIQVKNGLMFDVKNDTVIDVRVADIIAQINGEFYAENFVKKYDGKTLLLTDTLKIEKEIES